MKYPIILAILTSCSLLNQYPDNPLEEAAENFIEEETGVKIDFTGNSPE